MQEQKLIPAGKPELSFMINTTNEPADGQVSIPPLLTGGVLQMQDIAKSKGIDWLSLSVSTSSALHLLERTKKLDGPPKYFKGFGIHELRECWGGQCQRHYGPHSKSLKWGKDYELWSWTGENARSSFEYTSGQCSGVLPNLREIKGAKCTRVDVAFDIRCTKDVSPTDIVNACRETIESQGIKCGTYSEGDIVAETRYIGTSTSERRIRIYRKDIQSPTLITLDASESGKDYYEMPPRLRIELVLKRDMAEALYKVSIENEEEAYRIAAQHIYEMCGIVLSDDMGAVPKIPKSEDSGLAEKIAHMVNQYGEVLDLIDNKGVSLKTLLSCRRNKISRMSLHRAKKGREKASGLTSAQIEASALAFYDNRF